MNIYKPPSKEVEYKKFNAEAEKNEFIDGLITNPILGFDVGFISELAKNYFNAGNILTAVGISIALSTIYNYKHEPDLKSRISNYVVGIGVTMATYYILAGVLDNHF